MLTFTCASLGRYGGEGFEGSWRAAGLGDDDHDRAKFELRLRYEKSDLRVAADNPAAPSAHM
jgi:hypothetical protein